MSEVPGLPAAAVLRALHKPGEPLILPNIWDAATARLVAAAGFPALATSSAAVAEALGYTDGEATPVAETLGAIARITRAVIVPVTADMERGYGLGPAELVERLAAAGAVGCNLEDSDPRTEAMIDAGQQADFLAAIRSAARDAGVDLVINARVDTFMNGRGEPPARLAEALDRAQRYFAAGADCVYPIFASDPTAIRALVERAGGPINILRHDDSPGLADLAALGVARISFGAGLFRDSLAHVRTLVGQIRG